MKSLKNIIRDKINHTKFFCIDRHIGVKLQNIYWSTDFQVHKIIRIGIFSQIKNQYEKPKL
jgi:hypothetical protein